MISVVDFTNLKRLLEPRKVRAAVSAATGISEGNLGDWMRGRSRPAADSLVKLADYFDCSIDYLVGRKEKTAPGLAVAVEGAELRQLISSLSDEDKGRLLEIARQMKQEENDQ